MGIKIITILQTTTIGIQNILRQLNQTMFIASLTEQATKPTLVFIGHLAATANTMMLVGHTAENDEGLAGELNAADRDAMAQFLLSVSYPPAQRRSYTNEVSSRALAGFELFHVKGDLDGKPRPNVCGNCHRMPFLVSTNTPGTGMDAPTWRGAYDRWLILPQGRLNIIEDCLESEQE